MGPCLALLQHLPRELVLGINNCTHSDQQFIRYACSCADNTFTSRVLTRKSTAHHVCVTFNTAWTGMLQCNQAGYPHATVSAASGSSSHLHGTVLTHTAEHHRVMLQHLVLILAGNHSQEVASS